MAHKNRETETLSKAVARIQAGVLAITCGLICGLGLFAMTAWLLVKGGSQVGQHLQLLGNYFIGYSVSWLGSVVGLIYGSLFGGLIGWGIGRVYNWVVTLRQGPEA
ncbi:MAG: hypothetical protein JNJ50_08895 [Acidobacteria bacterium]|nr:hypothetical protein [Acidobacteriota bacterium]